VIRHCFLEIGSVFMLELVSRHESSSRNSVLMLLGAIPTWPRSPNWGYGPSGGLALILVILIILLATGRL